MFIYTELAQHSSVQISMNYVNVFAVFGFNQNVQVVQDCVMNVSVQFQVVTAALVCIKCDLIVQISTLVFIASGQRVSSVLLESQDMLVINDTTIQYRFNSSNASGVINQIQALMTTFTFNNVYLSGFNFIKSPYNGYLVSHLNMDMILDSKNFVTCVEEEVQSIGKSSYTFKLSEPTSSQCASICPANLHVAYGVCIDKLILGYLLPDFSFSCIAPFYFNGVSCVCQEGHVLKGLVCISIIGELERIQNQIDSNFLQLEQWVSQNVSSIRESIESNYSYLGNGIIVNTSVLDQQIYNSKNLLIDRVSSFNWSGIDDQIRKLQVMDSQMSQTIKNSFVELTINLQENISKLNSTIQEMNVDQQNQLVQKTSQFINDQQINNNLQQKQLLNDIQTIICNIQQIDSSQYLVASNNLINISNVIQNELINNISNVKVSFNVILEQIQNSLNIVNQQSNLILVNLQQTTQNIIDSSHNNLTVIQNEVQNIQYILNTINSNITQLNTADQIIQQKINEQMAYNQNVYFKPKDGKKGDKLNDTSKDMFFCIDSECIKIN
ncbi:Hypothetical_protein [Hexamita inflata]|uniref:Hypothetical_protein n=1 Tax=Hexamita inflata TaxID=28002 RepID=A0AA86TSV2_9EUKA|nr:Hypothetical protein HINF_LOCUS14790 [Hexamita inflata]